MSEAGVSPRLSASMEVVWFVVVGAMALVACERAPLDIEPEPTRGSMAADQVGPDGRLLSRPEPIELSRSLTIDLPETPRAFDKGDAALVNAVRKHDGLVFIGLKPAAAAHTLETGIVPAMARMQVLEAHQALESRGVAIERTYASFPVVLAVVAPQAAPELRKLPVVNYIEPVEPGTIAAPLRVQQDTSWGVHKVRVPESWLYNTGHGASITIIDTGIDSVHLFSGDGPVRLSQCLTTMSFSTCFDANGHGSHVAGIAAARDDGQGYIGIRNFPGTAGRPLASVRVCGALGICLAGALVGGLDWTTTNGWSHQIVNMSLVMPHSTTLATAIAASYNTGNLLVAAAGNGSNTAFVEYPARYSQVIAVSGTLPNDSPAGWITCPNEDATYAARSNFGPQVELSAPFYATSMWLNGTYETHCGTSMATPVVSGIAALVWTEHPSWTNAQVRAHLQATAIDLGSPGRDQYYGYGRVDALRALGPKVTISGPSTVQQGQFAQWSASASGGESPYTYAWLEDGSPVGTGSSYGTSVGSQSFDLSVTVTDDAGNTASAGRFIHVTSCPPPQIICE